MAGPLAWLESENMDYGIILTVVGALLAILLINYLGITEGSVFSWIIALAPLWLPSATFLVFFSKHMDTVGKLFYLDLGRVTFEVVLPQEVYKSPEAMEQVLSFSYNKATPDNLMETYLQGKRPQVFSFEIVGRGGEVKMYLNVPKKKGSDLIESAFYSQYPGIELKRVAIDYSAEIPHNLKDRFLMSFHMCKSKDQAYPIKTYLDIGLDKLPKEEEKVDPLTVMLEYMSTLKPHEQVWVQYLAVAHRDQNFKNGQLRSAPTWEKAAQAQIEKVMQRDAGPTDFDGMPRLSPGERSLVEVMERNIEKPAFEMVGRWMYIVDLSKGKPNSDRFSGMLRAFAAFDVAGRNKIGPAWRTDFNYKFISDPFGKRLEALRKQELKEYKLRKLFPKVMSTSSKIFTTEELATLWHPVGTVALTPTLSRVSSQKSQAPANLPIASQ